MKILGYSLFGILVVALLSTNIIIHFTTQEEVRFTVEHRERVVTGDNSRYMIWGNLGNRTEVFENVDSTLALKFNSADLYGEMLPGRECVATVNGFRIPWASMNRNILDVSCKRK